MNIYESVLNISSECRNLLWEVEKILGDDSLKLDDWWRVFEKRRGLSINVISKMLRDRGLIFNDNDLNFVLQVLLSNYKTIIRNEYWHKDTEYELLDRKFWEHTSQQVHYSFEDDMKSKKVFLLISDTHLGNEKMFNSRLLNNLYDYAIKMGATKCFHLGDLFEGRKGLKGNIYEIKINRKEINLFEEDFSRQINLFINEYPKTNPNEFKTYCLLGNRDETMNRFLQIRDIIHSSDLRKLSMYDPSFYMFPRSHWCTNLNDVSFHFDHRLYMSAIIDDLKINELADIEKEREIVGNLALDTDYDVLISGHLHKGIIYTGMDYSEQKDKLYLGVPSSSNINVGGDSVGYLVYMYPETNSMEVLVLGCDNNLNIYEIDRFFWKFGKRNKTYRRTL